MKRTVTIICTQDLTDRQQFRDGLVIALSDYAYAVERLEAGNDDRETFKATNGVELRIEHTKEAE